MLLNYPKLMFKHLASPKGVVREGSAQSNHPEPMLKNCTHLTISVVMWFEKVQGGSMRLNYPKLMLKLCQ